MKYKQLIAIIVAITGVEYGCVLEDINKLGDHCPGVKIVQLGGHRCTETDSTDAVCSGFIESGVFKEQQCPLNYECLGSDGEDSQCNCPQDCGTTCCEARYECSRTGEKCVLKPDEKCLSNNECSDRDDSTPYCVDGICVECTESSQCQNTTCEDGVCIECTNDADCEGNPKGNVCAHGKCAECDTKTFESLCLSANEIRACEKGVIFEGQCDADTPLCIDSACVECDSQNDCELKGMAFCRNHKCERCKEDSECAYRKDGKNTCVNGLCAECDPKAFTKQCEGNELTACQNNQVVTENCGDRFCEASSESGCVECLKAEDCPEGTHGCNSKFQCIECLNSEECTSQALEGRPFCNADGVCVQCTDNTHCNENGVCDLEHNQCVECVANTDCASKSDKSVCENYTCVKKCSGNSDCLASEYCQNELCVAIPIDNINCINDEQCTDDAIGRICDTTGHCVPCTSEKGCDSGKVCNLNSKKCVECINDSDCNEGKVCDFNHGSVCVECYNDDHCPETKPSCENNTCIGCNIGENQCSNNYTLKSCVNYRYKEDKCPDERPICMGNVCVQCEEGKTRCSGTKVQKCMDSQWKDDPECLGICDGGRCEIYQYVRIVDLTNGSGEDPGADIDAVEIWRNGEMVGYAESIADKSKDFSHIDQSTGKHDAVVDSSTCHYKKCGTSTLLFTSLGGNNNFIVYKMSAPIYNNDIIKVYEIGGCYLDNIQSNCSVRTTYTAGKDSFQVSISTSANNNIKDIGTSVNKGPIIEFPVSF